MNSKKNLIHCGRYSSLINFLFKNNFKSINIIGCPGSGKTTISKKLKKDLSTDLLNIDSLFEEFKEDSQIKDIIVNKLTASKKIIIDGTYVSLLNPERIGNTDLFVFVNSSILNSIFKVTRRAILGQNKYKNEKLSLRLLKQILLFERKKALIESRVERNKIYYY